MYRLLSDNVYLTEEYIIKNIFFSHGCKGQGCACIEISHRPTDAWCCHLVSQPTPFAERKGLVMLEPSSCRHGRNLL